MSNSVTGCCPKCGGNLFTHDAILVECENCNFVSCDITLLEESTAETSED